MSDFPLHAAAIAEADGEDVAALVDRLLLEGHDPHRLDDNGETAFNIAAPASPVCGRLMTHHWLSLALEGRGEKGLNDRSGSHGSTLAQYIAKWSSDDEIENQITAGVAKGMIVNIPNASGWTSLAAASAMGRVRAVEVFAKQYSKNDLLLKTTEEYKASYQGCIVVYAAGLTAEELAAARLAQDHGLTSVQKRDFMECMRLCRRFLK